MRSTRKHWLAGVAAAAALVAMGCDGGSEPAKPVAKSGAGGGDAPQRYVIGVIAKAQGNPVFKAAREGAEQAARDLSEKYGADITINWRTPNTEDAQQQASYIEQLVGQGVNGIAISCSDANVVTGVINDAVSRGVYVVTFDSDAPESDRMAYYGVNDEQAGAAVMSELAKAMGDKGRVAVLTGNPNAANLAARVRGVETEAAKHPDIEIVNVFPNPTEGAAEAASIMKTAETGDPSINGWALVGGWPLYTDNALDGIYDKAKIVSLDPLPLPLEYLKKGQVQVLIGQPYYGWGYKSVEMLVEKIIDVKDPSAEFVWAEMDYVTADKADEFIKRWNEWNK